MKVQQLLLITISFWVSVSPSLALGSEEQKDSETEYLLGLKLEELMEIPILGQGEIHQVQEVLSEEMRYAIPGSNPLKVLEKFPGVHFQSADPWRNYEWASKLSIRGFKEHQLGFTLDDIPLGDMLYGNSHGLHLSRAITLENLEKIRISQGSGDLSTAATTNLGGTMQLYSAEPKNLPHATASQTWGSHHTLRTFTRLDSGLFNQNMKAYMSLAKLQSDKWKGWGSQEHEQFNAKVMQGEDDRNFSLFLNISRRDETDYADFSLDSRQRLGWGWDNYAPDWQRALEAAQGIYHGQVQSVDDAYFLGRGLREDELVALQGYFALSNSLTSKNTVYYHQNRGQGHWYTPYWPSSATVPISLRVTDYGIERWGVLSNLLWKPGQHEVMGGIWVEKNQHTHRRSLFGLAEAYDTDFFLEDPELVLFEQVLHTTTHQFYVQDTWTQDKWKISIGGKSPAVNIEATSQPKTLASGSLRNHKDFLPQLGLNYALNPTDELFFSYAYNALLFSGGRIVFETTQPAFDQTVAALRMEESTSFDFGVRLQRENIQASLALYSVLFKNRWLRIAQCNAIVGCPYAFANVGNVETKGLEATMLWLPFKQISWFNAFTYNDSTYQSNYWDANTWVEVAGKTVIDTPKILFSSELTYEKGGYFARLGGKYTSQRFITYTNDASVPGFMVWYLSAGYAKEKAWKFRNLRLQLNVDNLFDKPYLGPVGVNGFLASDPLGKYYTLQESNPRQFFLTLMVTF